MGVFNYKAPKIQHIN